MAELIERIKQKALAQQFLVDTDTPEKLRMYFFREFLSSIVGEVTKINKLFYNREDNPNGYEIKILDREIYVVSKDESTIFGHYVNEEKVAVLEVYNYTTNAKVTSKSTGETIDLSPADLEYFLLQTLG